MNIIPMSRPSLRAAGCAASLFVASSPLFAGEVVLHKVPAFAVDQARAYPVNLARYHAGAQLETVASHPISQLQLSTQGEDKNAAEAALLCDDPTVGYALPAGTTTLLVTFPKVENIGSLAFLNKGSRGQVTVATANAKLPASSPQWQTLTEQELSGDALHASVGPAEAKYVRLTFNLQEPGRIAGLGLYATPRVSDFTSPTAPVVAS
ncbi:MAG: hypothetical protein M3Z32_00815, partial [Acidobacteriota bacterium]|nr:hypothetical protein [Acidobacteriota bacterium]